MTTKNVSINLSKIVRPILAGLDDLDRRMLAEAKANAPVGRERDVRKFKKGTHKHLRDTGRVIKAVELGDGVIKGGFKFTAPYAIFVEKGHKVGGAVKTSKAVEGRHFMLNALEAHRDEITSGSFLKRKG